MALHVALQHRTTYAYDRPVELGPQVIRLRPAPHCRTRIVSYSLEVEPKGHFLNWQQDPHGNHLARLVIPEPTTRFAVEVGLVAEIAVINPFDFFLEPAAEAVPFAYEPLLKKDLEPYLEVTPPGPRLRALLASIPQAPEATVSFLVELNGAPAARDRLRDPHGGGHPELRGDPASSAAARVATPPGCWSRSCASAASRRASCPAT